MRSRAFLRRAPCCSTCARICIAPAPRKAARKATAAPARWSSANWTRKAALALKAVNACIQFLPTLDGKALFTVEDLRGADGALHPVQQAMVDCHGSQCGFCTPGFVMSMWALYENQPAAAGLPTRDEINAALSGNLCRCTGYRPIVDASQKMFDYPQYPRVTLDREAVAGSLRELQRRDTFEYCAPDTRGAAFGSPTFHAPVSLDAFAALRAAHPHARLLAGSTDVGLWVTKQFRDLGDILYIGNVAELKTIERDAQTLTIGAAVTLEDAYAALAADYPELAELWTRFASLPIRNAGTLGGNVANGSPIGDSMPALIALGAEVVLRHGPKTRTLPLDAFYLGYQKTALVAGEFVAALRVPRPAGKLRFRTYKVSKRYDQDISAVCAAFALHLGENGVIERGAHRVRRHGGHAEAGRANRSRPERRDMGRKHRAASDECARRRLPAAHRHARIERVSTEGGAQRAVALPPRNAR